MGWCYLVFPILFLFWPFGAFVLSLIVLFMQKLSKNETTMCLVIMSLFWGLLAFTQKSLAVEDTDCIRYYRSLEYFEGWNPMLALCSLNLIEILNYVFSPVSVFVTALTDNVQSISFLWTFLVYLLTFLSMRRLMKYYECYEQRKFAKLVLIMTFCFLAFVQVSELLKNSAAFAVFFYAFTLQITNNSRMLVWALVLVSIGIHPSVIMLLPLFFYKLINAKIALAFAVIVFLLSLTINIVDMLMSFLPSGIYFDLLFERFGNQEIGETGTLHYIGIQMAMVGTASYLWFRSKDHEIEKLEAVNIIILYFIVSVVNFYNLVAFLRFTIFSHWIFGLITIWYLKKSYISSYKRMMNLMIFFMLFMTLRWTYGRTMVIGGYCSSYMNNSITNIIFSTSYDYICADYEK